LFVLLLADMATFGRKFSGKVLSLTVDQMPS